MFVCQKIKIEDTINNFYAQTPGWINKYDPIQ